MYICTAEQSLAIILSICHAISYHYTIDLSNAPFVA